MRVSLALLLTATATLLPGVTAARAAAPAPSGPPPLAASGTLHGTVVSAGWSQLTIRPHGRSMSVPGALTASADAVAAGDFPYVWGGGHPEAGVPSAARRGGRVGYDCSGSVAAVLAGAGLWAAGSGVPSDAGIIAALRSERLLTRGAGTGPASITLWDDPGVHIFMQIGSRFFGTSDGAGGSAANPNDGAGWLDDGAADTLSRAYRPWHLDAAALSGTVVYGPTVTLGLLGDPVADAVAQLSAGDRVAVTYVTRAHTPLATAVAGL